MSTDGEWVIPNVVLLLPRQRVPEVPELKSDRFDAGVTTITPSPHTAHLLLVGSYDSILRVYDTRQPNKAVYEIDVGGGIWRTRFHPDQQRKGDVLIAAMHGAFKIVQVNLSAPNDGDGDGDWRIKVEAGRIVRTFDGHTSLAYGADWSRLPMDPDGQSLIATCSFYDRAMHLWRG